jgi:hypothetical protein
MDIPDGPEQELADIKRWIAEGRVPADCLRAVLIMRASMARRDAERREWWLRRLEDQDPAAAACLQELLDDQQGPD